MSATLDVPPAEAQPAPVDEAAARRRPMDRVLLIVAVVALVILAVVLVAQGLAADPMAGT